jgi:hypothetical protein
MPIQSQALTIPTVNPARAASVVDSLTQEALIQRFNNQYDAAIATLDLLESRQPDQPRVPFMKAAVYLAETFDTGATTNHGPFLREIEQALHLADGLQKSDAAGIHEARFIRGAAFGYRGAYAIITHSWWTAFNDGRKGLSELESLVDQDPGNYDAYLGLGMFTYWRSKMMSKLSWLPFVTDQREQGIAWVRLAAEKGEFVREEAWGNLILILTQEERPKETLEIVDAFLQQFPESRFLLHAAAIAHRQLNNSEAAEAYYHRLRLQIPDAPFAEYPNVLHYDLAEAQIAASQGQDTRAAKLCQRVLTYPLSDKDRDRFSTARDKARGLLSGLNERHAQARRTVPKS